jgi:hypothetical protein
MGILRQRTEEGLEVLVDHGVARDGPLEDLILARARQLAVAEQVRDFEEVAVLGQLFDRVAAIAQDALVAIDERDCARAGAGVRVAGIECDEPGGAPELADVDGAFAFAAFDDGEGEDLIADTKFSGFRHRGSFRSNFGDAARRSRADIGSG